MKSTIAKKTEGYGYKYTELADINKYCEQNDSQTVVLQNVIQKPQNIAKQASYPLK